MLRHRSHRKLCSLVPVMMDPTDTPPHPLHSQDEYQHLAQLAAIVEFADYAIIGKTLDGIITSWNRGAERLYGFMPSEVIGRPISIVTPADRAAELSAIDEYVRRG